MWLNDTYLGILDIKIKREIKLSGLIFNTAADAGRLMS